MAFTPLFGDSGKYCLVKAANGVTFVKGNACADSSSSGLITNASAGQGTDVEFVVMESVTTTSAGQQVLCCRVEGVTFLADCDAAWSTTDQQTYCDLAAAGTVDPDATSDNLFFLEKGVGAAETGTQVIGHFVYGAPNS